MNIYKNNIESETTINDNYRKVIHTDEYQQLVLMSLLPKEEIGMEIHHDTTQFIRIEKGSGRAIVGNKTFNLRDGDCIVIPPHVWHNIYNTSKIDKLKLYTIYSPPHHPSKTIQKKKPLDD